MSSGNFNGVVFAILLVAAIIVIRVVIKAVIN